VKHLKKYESKIYPSLSRRKHLKGKVEMLVNEYAPWYNLLNKESAIYRGIKHKDGRKKPQDVYIIDPSEHNRVSIDTDNTYTLIIDNSEYWKDYPKRSESVICSTNLKYAQSFGEVYRVIPIKENTLFGKCEEDDIFQCFWQLKYIDDSIDNPRDLDNYLKATFNIPNYSKTESYEKLQKLLSKENLDFDGGYIEGQTSTGMTVKKFDEIVEEYGSYLKYLENLMMPSSNGFETFNYSQKDADTWLTKEHSSNEVWTDSKCLLVKESYIKYYVR